MSEKTEYVCAECGKPAIIEEEYEVFAPSYGCAGTDFRYLCKEHFLECFPIHTHHSVKCNCCGKDLSTMNYPLAKAEWVSCFIEANLLSPLEQHGSAMILPS